MRVEQDVKLTFDDVLIRPKRSTLISRSDVTLVRISSSAIQIQPGKESQ